jgi:type IX secretion system PorP/SprF family membrane protein
MKKIKIILSVFLAATSFAQQDAGFSMYFFNPVYVNPGYAGSREVISGTMVHRSQWAAMNGAPSTQTFSLHSAIPNSRIGLGFQLYNDNAGPMRNTGLNLSYAYHLPLSKESKLSFGVTGMLSNLKVDWDRINVPDENDLAFTQTRTTNWVPDAAVGLYYYQKRFYAGFSINHLMESKFGLSTNAGSDLAKFYRQYYLTSGIVVPINGEFNLRPSVLVKLAQANSAVLDLNAVAIYKQHYYFGLGYRFADRISIPGTDNMLVGIFQYEFTRFFRVGYAFDYFLNQNKSYNSAGSHEIMLGWDFNPVKTKMSNPRFF